MIYTTLNKIRERQPCADGWHKLLEYLGKTQADDEPLALETILDSNGLADCFWSLRAVDGHDREIRLLACDYAEHVLHIFEKQYPDDPRPRQAIETARQYANGDAALEETWAAARAARSAAQDAVLEETWAAAQAAADAARAAWDAARAAWDAAWSATWDAAWAARAARTAAQDAARAAERNWQEQKLREMLKC